MNFSLVWDVQLSGKKEETAPAGRARGVSRPLEGGDAEVSSGPAALLGPEVSKYPSDNPSPHGSETRATEEVGGRAVSSRVPCLPPGLRTAQE